jgi:hypothetical protein
MKNNIYSLIGILDAINQELEVFLKDNQVIILKNEKIDSYSFDGRIALVNLSDETTTLVAILSIEEKLFQTYFNKCFYDVCKTEREEIEEAMPSEIINLIVGLSIRHFPKELDNFTLGVPYLLPIKEVESMFDTNPYKRRDITTDDGDIRIGILELSAHSKVCTGLFLLLS